MKMKFVSAIVVALAAVSTVVLAAKPGVATSDAAFVRKLPGFQNGQARVNGVRLHYVAGGSGPMVVLLPGWPQTWWSYQKIMPTLAKNHRVVAVDIRGMGTSEKPKDGYQKKVMAQDIVELIHQLGVEQADVVGHDIGAQVAFSMAANHPETVRKLVMLDVAHPDAGFAAIPMLPGVGTFREKVDAQNAYLWWFAFHQVKGLPEDLLAGRFEIEQKWFFHYMLKDDASIDAFDREVYRAAYNTRDAIRAGDAWYQAFPQDIEDERGYDILNMPVLALGGPGYDWLKATLPKKARNLQVVKIENSGHFVIDERPAETVKLIADFIE